MPRKIYICGACTNYVIILLKLKVYGNVIKNINFTKTTSSTNKQHNLLHYTYIKLQHFCMHPLTCIMVVDNEKFNW